MWYVMWYICNKWALLTHYETDKVARSNNPRHLVNKKIFYLFRHFSEISFLHPTIGMCFHKSIKILSDLIIVTFLLISFSCLQTFVSSSPLELQRTSISCCLSTGLPFLLPILNQMVAAVRMLDNQHWPAVVYDVRLPDPNKENCNKKLMLVIVLSIV